MPSQARAVYQRINRGDFTDLLRSTGDLRAARLLLAAKLGCVTGGDSTTCPDCRGRGELDQPPASAPEQITLEQLPHVSDVPAWIDE